MVADFFGALAQGLGAYGQGRLDRRERIMAQRQQEFANQMAERGQALAEKQVEDQWKRFRIELAAADRRFNEEMAFRKEGKAEDALRWAQSFMLQTNTAFDNSALQWARLREDRLNGLQSRWLAGIQGMGAYADVRGKWIRNARDFLGWLADRNQGDVRQRILETQAMMGQLIYQNMGEKLDVEVEVARAQKRVTEAEAEKLEAILPIFKEKVVPLMGVEAELGITKSMVDVLLGLANVGRTRATTELIGEQAAGQEIQNQINELLKGAIPNDLERKKVAEDIANDVAQINLDFLSGGAAGNQFAGKTDDELKRDRQIALGRKRAAINAASDLLEPGPDPITKARRPWGFTMDELRDVAESGRLFEDPSSKEAVRVKDDRYMDYYMEISDAEEELRMIEDELARRAVPGYELPEKQGAVDQTTTGKLMSGHGAQAPTFPGQARALGPWPLSQPPTTAPEPNIVRSRGAPRNAGAMNLPGGRLEDVPHPVREGGKPIAEAVSGQFTVVREEKGGYILRDEKGREIWVEKGALEKGINR